MPCLRIGISGWTYAPWRGGAFFPKDLPRKAELPFASRRVNSIEINGTFYSLQRPASFAAWRKATPEDFVFAVKGGRFITHLKRLKDVAAPIANFFASGVLALREKLGPILWQLPPSFRYDAQRLEDFFRLLPRDTRAAALLARKHDHRLDGRAFVPHDRRRPLRYALEIRHPSFENPEFIRQLRRHQIALVVADTAGRWPFFEDVTSDFVYVRLHGDEKLYISGYTDSALDEWARKIRGWSKGRTPVRTRRICSWLPPAPRGRDIFVYFDNDVKVRAPFDAMSLAHKLGLGPKPGSAPDEQFVAEEAGRGWPSVKKSR
jgi:uncharacterized protein YecE (DUF72 family)